MTLILGASFLAVVPVMKRLLGDLRGKRCAFISTASYAEPYGVANRAMRYWLRALGLGVKMIDVSTAPEAELVNTLEHADLFYVCGGNTFYLLEQLRHSGADRLIRERVLDGVPYVGESAGSVICGPDIGYIGEMDSSSAAPSLFSTRGLDLVDCAIVPHVDSKLLGVNAAVICQTGAASAMLVPLRNDQAVVVLGDRMHVETHPSVLASLTDRWF
ncbi:Type 1 glutamine amidotransferase-like domain-containing protein [Bifidobacterium choloepi]|nr:Type 1 glutamine amidotransferase-like domain-containing protein [Bifidobacterium choloepi]